MIGSGKQIPNRDADEIGLPARNFLSFDDRYVLVIDDFEEGFQIMRSGNSGKVILDWD